MDIKDILARVDHTLLKQTATLEQIHSLCDEAIEYATASVCIPPSYVMPAKAYVGDRVKICTVIGFPNGYSTTGVKCYEAEQALKNGADEIDMVINLGMVKDGHFDWVLGEIKAVKAVCGSAVLKVITENCYLTNEEKIRLCDVVTQAGADYIKTSTGFGTGGATPEDIALFKKYVGPGVKIKAAGGIATLADAQQFIALGADRLGSSRVIGLAKEARK